MEYFVIKVVISFLPLQILVTWPSSYLTELVAVIRPMDFSIERGWLKLWVETDLSNVVQDFLKPFFIPWQVKLVWTKCIGFFANWYIYIYHMYR